MVNVLMNSTRSERLVAVGYVVSKTEEKCFLFVAECCSFKNDDCNVWFFLWGFLLFFLHFVLFLSCHFKLLCPFNGGFVKQIKF